MGEARDELSLRERHEIVMRMTHINSEQLRRDSERNGLDLELLAMRNRHKDSEPSLHDSQEIVELERKISLLKQQQVEQRVEFERLQRKLLEFDEDPALQNEKDDG